MHMEEGHGVGLKNWNVPIFIQRMKLFKYIFITEGFIIFPDRPSYIAENNLQIL